MTNLCTLFDSNYLSRGIALYESLIRACPSFHLYVVAFDDKCYEYLSKAKLPHLTPISLKEFEDEELLKVKPTRSIAEYCWTCTSSVILYCLNRFKLDACTYIDADMVFYGDPKILTDEMGSDSILLSKHRYTKDYDVSDTHGIYCVQFMCFKNTEQGLTALTWWRDRCLEWCYARLEDGKFGDQKYLDDWLQRFTGVHVLTHPGQGIAPWNVQQFSFVNEDGGLYLAERNKNGKYPVIFFHFHGLKFYTDQFVSCCGAIYELTPEVKEIFYKPYIKSLLDIEARLKQQVISFGVNGARTAAPPKSKVWWEFMKSFGIMVMHGKASLWKPKNYNFKLHYHFYKTDKFK